MPSKPSYRAFAKLYITAANDSGEEALGSGVMALLRGVEQAGSLNRAAKEMEMAYSKAWKLVKRAEEHMGFALIEREGARGSKLTSEGVRLLQSFEAVSRKLSDYADELLQQELSRR